MLFCVGYSVREIDASLFEVIQNVISFISLGIDDQILDRTSTRSFEIPWLRGSEVDGVKGRITTIQS